MREFFRYWDNLVFRPDALFTRLVKGGDLAALQRFLAFRRFKPDTNPVHADGLRVAVEASEPVIVKHLLELGADANTLTPNKHTLLNVAIEANCEAAAMCLLPYTSNLEALHTFKRRPLHLACLMGMRGVAMALLEKGVAISVRSQDGSTPLHMAALGGNAQTVQLLLARGADPMQQDTQKAIPLHRASSAAVATVLLDAGCPVNALNWAQQTPLHLAAIGGYDDVAKVLLQRGADSNLRDFHQQTAYEWAQEHDDRPMMNIITTTTTVTEQA